MHQASRLRIDILLGAMPIEEEIVHGAAKVEIAGVAVPLPSPESIVLMKAIAQRARDVADIEGILEVHDHLDLDWIRERLTEFDRALDRSDLLDEFNRVVTRVRGLIAFDSSAE